jgi:hypothetical protein
MTGQFCNIYIVLIVITALAFIFGVTANRYKAAKVE